VIGKSDLLAVMPRRLALAIGDAALAVRDLPFKSAPFQWTMYWHRRHDGNPALAWLRQTLTTIAA
jgi:DNA-binding transcriptional LysR family regulator